MSDHHPRWSRLPALVLAAVLAVLVVGAWPAAAHDTTVLVEVRAEPPAEPGQPVRVTAVTTYADGHRAGGLTVRAVATKGGDRVEATLAAGARRGDWAGSLRLGPGRWKVEVMASGSAKGSGTATVVVPAATTSTSTTTTTVAPTTSAAGEAAGAASPPPDEPVADGDGPAVPTIIALGVGALATAFVAVRTFRILRRED